MEKIIKHIQTRIQELNNRRSDCFKSAEIYPVDSKAKEKLNYEIQRIGEVIFELSRILEQFPPSAEAKQMPPCQCTGCLICCPWT